MTSIIALGLAASFAAALPVSAADDGQDNTFARPVLARHNLERNRMGVTPLAWNDRLERDAQAWARMLASEGWLRHASQAENRGAGENLWMGTAGYYAPDAMVGAFLDERRHFRAGIWRGTREVGCAVARNAQDDFLVCRYWPAGNWTGEAPF